MMKLALFAALAGSAAAFAPAPVAQTSTALHADFSKELGAQMPLGYFDPMGIMKDGSQKRFDIFRECEITHGRVAMLAVTGYLVTAAGIRFPGAEEVPAGFGAINYLFTTDSGRIILPQMMLTFIVATIVNRDADWTDAEAEFIGDYRNGALDFGWDKLGEDAKMRKRAIELNNGRAAQMGILGLMVHEMMGVSILPGGVLPGQ